MKASSVVCLAALAAFAPLLAASEPPEVRVYRGPAPAIDGKLGDPCWERATTVHPFLLSPTGYSAVQQTRLMLSLDGGHLYAAFECECPDSEKLRVGDGDPLRNDRVELTLRWAGASQSVQMTVDAAGRHLSSNAPGGIAVAAAREPKAYTVEIAIPRPPNAESLEFTARRRNEVTDEESAWGTGELMAHATLASRPGPAVKLRHVPRVSGDKGTIELTAINPLETYITLRCTVAASEASSSVPHVVRLDARQSLPVAVAYNASDIRGKGFQIVLDDPQGSEVYLRSPDVHVLRGKPPAKGYIGIIPYPQHLDLMPQEEPFVVDSRCRILVGLRHNEAERRAAELVQREIKDLCGLELPIRSSEYFLADRAIVVATRRTTLLAERIQEKYGLKLPKGSPDQGYVIAIEPKLIGVAADQDTGTLYGVQTLLQILDSAKRGEGGLVVPSLRVRDWPSLPLRGCLWRGPRPDLPALYPALARFKVNLLSESQGAPADLAAANGIYLAKLGMSSEAAPQGQPQSPVVNLTPSESMPRPLRRSLRLPVPLEEGAVKPPAPVPEFAPPPAPAPGPAPQPLFPPKVAQPRDRRPKWATKVEPLPPPEPAEPEPVAMAWVRADPWALSDAARQATARKDMVGLCGAPRAGGPLPPSWANVVAASAYGWSPAGPSPEEYLAGFYRSFYGSAEVGEARDLLERAVACLPQQTGLAELLADRFTPGAPRADLAGLVAQARAKAATATRSKELAALLAQSGGRVLAAARNVATVLRLRALYAEAARHQAERRQTEVAKCLSEMAVCLTDGRAAVAALLGEEAGASADVKLYAAAAAAARKLSEGCAKGANLPEPDRFWRTLRGDVR